MKLFFIFCIYSYLLYADNSITITKDTSSLKEFNMQMYKDSSRKLSLADIRAKTDFKTVSNSLSQGYSNSNLWFKFQLKNSTDRDLRYILYFTENMTHYLDCYIIDNKNNIKHYKQGAGYFIKGSPNRLTNPKFEMEFKSGETKSIYIKMYSIYPNIGAFYLFDERGLNSYTNRYDKIYSAYFGGIFALMLYNVFLFLFSRNISYLYYVSLLVGYILWQLTLNNFPPFNIFYSTDSYYLAGTPVNFMIIFIIFFTRDLLSSKKYFPKLDKIMIAFAIISILITAITILFGHNTTIYLNTLAIVLFPFLLFIGFKSHFKGNKIAIFFIIAQTSFLITSTIFSLMMQGDIGYSIFTRHSIAVGSAIELLLFSLTLGYRIKLLQDEKIELIDRNHKELEIKVKERTKELEESKKVLQEMTITDPMTGLYNRRHLNKVSKELTRKRKLFSIVMLDIDKFKNINDTYGHDVGDDIIALFANIIVANIRDDDLTFRIGGEEFIVLLPNTNREDAYIVAEQVRKATQKERIKLNKTDVVSFTTSGGVSTLLDIDIDIDSIIKRADNALYRAKKSGRNKIII